MWDLRNLRLPCKSKVAGRHEDGKNVSPKKLQIKTNPDNDTDYILKEKASITLSVMQFPILLFFALPWELCASLVSVLPYLGIFSSAFSFGNFKLF